MTNYGEISRTEVTRKAMTYLGTNNREEMDSNMLFNCLRKSITNEVYSLVTTEPRRYVFEVNQEILLDGPCFLAAIIDHTYTNNKASIEAARENLCSLSEWCPWQTAMWKNLTFMKEQLETLAVRVETTNNLIANLFKGYNKVKDRTFRNGSGRKIWHIRMVFIGLTPMQKTS